MDDLFHFIEEKCQEYNIDESHGLKHARGTMERALAILDRYTIVPDDERKVVAYAAALHDICDKKYTDVIKSSNDIRSWLIDLQGWSQEHADAVIDIITSMSYSQLKLNWLPGLVRYPNHGKWQRAYHVARHADLLEGFIVARCVLYNRHIHPDWTDDQHWKRAEELFETRVFKYVAEGWITIPAALEQVNDLEAEARRCLRERSLDWIYCNF